MTNRMTIRVPGTQAAAVVAALITTYAGRTEALAGTVRAYRDGREPLTAVGEARRDVAEAEVALDSVGWQLGVRAADIELTGPAGGVREVLYVALLAAAGSAHTGCREYERGRIDRRALAAAIMELTALHALFAAVEEADAPDSS